MSTIKTRNSKDSNTIEMVYGKFIRLKKIKNISDSTIQFYNNCLKTFADYYSLENNIESVSKDVYLGYVEYLQNKSGNITDVSVNTYLRGIRVFLKYCMSKKYISEFKVELIRQTDVIKEPYTTDELRKLLEKPNIKKCDFSEYRTWTLENFFLATGVRLSTAVNIKISEVDFDNFVW